MHLPYTDVHDATVLVKSRESVIHLSSVCGCVHPSCVGAAGDRQGGSQQIGIWETNKLLETHWM